MWSGAISFGLVNVPIKLYSAVSKKTVRFHQLNGETGSRISQKRVEGLLAPLARKDSPFTGTQPPKLTHHVEPRLVASVEYTELTETDTLRHPVYKGLRDDIDPEDVTRPD